MGTWLRWLSAFCVVQVSGCHEVEDVLSAADDGTGDLATTSSAGTGASSGAGGTASFGGAGGVEGVGAAGGLGSGGLGSGGLGSGGLGSGGLGAGGDLGASSGAGGEPGVEVDVVMLDAGNEHSCAVLRGTLYCWGGNQRGRLGVGDGQNRVSPARVGNVESWVEVTTASDHSCARRNDGSVWCFGANDMGQLGSPGVNDVLSPIAVALPERARLVSAESAFSCALLEDASLYCWGQNTEGMLGQADDYPGEDQFSPVRVSDFDDWSFVDAGQGHACALRGVGNLWCWGRNSQDQLGLGDMAAVQYRYPQRVGDADAWVEVQAGQNHSCGLQAGGSLWCWGENPFGNLGTGDLASQASPLRIDDRNYSDLSLDTFHTCAIDTSSDLWCWGRNVEGQLGLGDIEDRLAPTRVATSGWVQVAVGRFHTCAKKLDDSVWCTGENVVGQLGVGDTDRRNEFTRVMF